MPGKKVSMHNSGSCTAFARDANVPERNSITTEASFHKGWAVRDRGASTWDGVQAVRIASDYGPEVFGTPAQRPGQEVEIGDDITPPERPEACRANY